MPVGFSRFAPPWSRVLLACLGACLVLFVVGPLPRLLLAVSPAGLGVMAAVKATAVLLV